MHPVRGIAVGLGLLALLACGSLQAAEYYVAPHGKGKEGSKEKPVRDLGIIIPKLQAGDTVHLAAGVYLGRGSSGADKIEVPVRIIGGYNEDFSQRDPWGKYRTILTGDNLSDNFESAPRLHVGSRSFRARGRDEKLAIVIDGVIVDNGPRNGYEDEQALKIRRRYNPKTKSNAAPDTPGISIDAPEGTEVTVRNCVVLNCAPHHKSGAIKVFAGRGCKVLIENNLVINNTGSGILCASYYHPKDGAGVPEYTVRANSVLFSWRYDPLATDCGSGIKLESSVRATIQDNVLAFCDAFGLDNAARSKVVALSNNLFCGTLIAPYLEFSTRFKLASVEEESECVEACADNVQQTIQLELPAEWAERYAARNVVDRAVAEAAVEPLDNWQNELRRMLGLPLQGGKIDVGSEVWLHRLEVEAAIRCGSKKLLDRYGCAAPVF
ncbi:MAG: hypothetical protein KatS3mg102_1847 [Planctomycetota bacterium]|nr:MAG: hypothetical protein KatS3mg102_1847 [Planctomycetota bacterium]